jgi:hypothetical protein
VIWPKVASDKLGSGLLNVGWFNQLNISPRRVTFDSLQTVKDL